MKILVINGDCLLRNSSANLCHLAYINGLVDAGHEVTLLSADGRDYILDPSLRIPDGVKSYTYYGTTLYEKLAIKKNRIQTSQGMSGSTSHSSGGPTKGSLKGRIVKHLKKKVLSFYGVHGIYSKFIKTAKKFKSDIDFDFVISISTPMTGHLIAHNLLSTGHIHAKHWIQIWEDPWYSDAYGFNGSEKVFKEEKRLLSYAERVCYVSPITLRNQQRLYPESADKMYWQPLPFYYQNDEPVQLADNEYVFGYFGDYVPEARNLAPFYEAAKELSVSVNICGNPSNLFEPTDTIHIYPRMPLSELKDIENKTNVLVFLCNRKGGQIPGKIYQYSATTKTILFILDGTQEEKDELYHYFVGFNRYVFCENTREDIMRAINDIVNNQYHDVENKPLIDQFNPVIIIENILKGK